MNFDACEVCNSQAWSVIYEGPIRDGAFGEFAPSTIISRCGKCGSDRLAEESCHKDDIYDTEEYRNLVGEDTTAEGFFKQHDWLHRQWLEDIWEHVPRNSVIADVGCAAGSLLDHLKGVVAETVAIEPGQNYHDSLRARGHKVFSSIEEANKEYAGKIDLVFNMGMIEHVVNPLEVLKSMSDLMAEDGEMMVMTPNRDDLLMTLLPDDYPSFNYHTVHRWYWDHDSFSNMVELAGMKTTKFKCCHRFGLSNTLAWLRDRKPAGQNPLPETTTLMLDRMWREHLDETRTGDSLVFWLSKS